jgi:hypothetical protein
MSKVKKVKAEVVLFNDVTQLIEESRGRVATAINAELTMLYWRVGERINAEVLKGKRAEYGKEVILTLSYRLTLQYGKGWSDRQLRQCARFALVFSDERIVHTLCTQFSFSHLRLLMAIEDPAVVGVPANDLAPGHSHPRSGSLQSLP